MRDPYNALMPYPSVPVASGDGPLNGLRFVVKDLFDVAGYRTGCGNAVRLAESRVAEQHAPAVARLLQAGAVFAGKAQTDELAWSLTGKNPYFGDIINPTAPDRISGGSSSGCAAAVAGGLAEFALGTDTGGSVRAPASFCGVWGLRPTWGRVPLAGCMPLVPSFDTGGLFARDGVTLLAVAAALLGPDNANLEGEEPLLAEDLVARLPDEVKRALETTFARLSGGGVDLYVEDAETMHTCFDTLQSREVVETQGPWIEEVRPPLGPMIRARYTTSLAVTPAMEAEARNDRERITGQLVDRLAGRAVLAPVVHDVPLRADAGVEQQMAFSDAARRLLCVAGIAGLPQVVFPAVRIGGAPIGLSLIGPPGSDLALVALAARLVEPEMAET
ncbi:amidase [Algicella marina]|uniref:Amidase n=1 Tax=Algicella marina TaxID=2683284 RepID=A0A6P1SXK0_9RHOB|nr:amidase [Algicella marina]QHQ34380.1 amidase [Algicella marina]